MDKQAVSGFIEVTLPTVMGLGSVLGAGFSGWWR